ncbi:MAG: homoserine kinase [Gemmatimonadetes bacterium]|nr:homoserine kinase [Gemmatimonadota bacterium]MBI2614748.1 homoserine kinase [Gemmatimonadota bacterium]
MSLAVRVPASTSNLGAGFDCVGLALDLWLEARLFEGDGPATYAGTLADLSPERDLIARTMRSAGLSGRRRLEVRSEIPVGKGLGSSGAAVVAGLALVDLARGAELNRDRLLEQATALEGHPDNVGPAVYGGLFLASQGGGRLTLSPAVGIALAVPEASIDTHAARARLPREVAREVAIAQASRAAALIQGLTQGQPALIAYGMEDQLAVPHRKDLIPGFDAAVVAGRAAGAYGVTISGAGSALLGIGPPHLMGHVASAMAEALTQAGNRAAGMTPRVAMGGLTVTTR